MWLQNFWIVFSFSCSDCLCCCAVVINLLELLAFVTNDSATWSFISKSCNGCSSLRCNLTSTSSSETPDGDPNGALISSNGATRKTDDVSSNGLGIGDSQSKQASVSVSVATVALPVRRLVPLASSIRGIRTTDLTWYLGFELLFCQMPF